MDITDFKYLVRFQCEGYYEVWFNGVFVSRHIKPEIAQGVLSSLTFAALANKDKADGYIKPPVKIKTVVDMSLLNLVFSLSGTNQYVTPPDTGSSLKPVPYSFYVDATNKDRVYFSTTGTIDGMTSTGFTISNKTISSLTVNTGQLTGHYFTVSSAFTWWDNNTIRLEGGDNTTYDFTLSYITNNIEEPGGTNSIFVNVSATGSNDGTSEANAFTSIQSALNAATAGSIIYIKAGQYNIGTWLTLPNVGTASAPLKIIGYKTSYSVNGGYGDITSNYYSYTFGSSAPALSSTEMPFIYPNSTAYGGFYGSSDNYIIIKNIQVGNGNTLLRNYSGFGMVVENCNFKESGDGGGDGSALEMYSSTTGSNYDQSNYRVKDCYIINAGMANMDIKGDGNLIENVKTYCDNTVDGYSADGVSDYYINIVGSNNIVKNSYAQRRQGVATAASGHGIGVKAGESSSFYNSNYNLFDGNYVTGCWEGLYARNTGAEYNVYKNNQVYGYDSGSTSYGSDGNGIALMNDANNNIFENNLIYDLNAVYYILSDGEVPGTSKTINSNTFRNNIAYNCSRMFNVTNNFNSSYNTPFSGNKFYNNTYSIIDSWVYTDDAYTGDITFTSNEFKNSILNLVTGVSSITGMTFDYNDFYGSNAIGTNYITDNPTFDTDGYTPTNTALKEGTPLTGVEYDYEGTERDATTPTIGAIEI